MFTGKKRMGAERAEEKGDIYLFIVYLFDSRSFSHFLFLRHRIMCWPGPLPKG